MAKRVVDKRCKNEHVLDPWYEYTSVYSQDSSMSSERKAIHRFELSIKMFKWKIAAINYVAGGKKI